MLNPSCLSLHIVGPPQHQLSPSPLYKVTNYFHTEEYGLQGLGYTAHILLEHIKCIIYLQHVHVINFTDIIIYNNIYSRRHQDLFVSAS